jgi:hypothetical protein
MLTKTAAALVSGGEQVCRGALASNVPNMQIVTPPPPPTGRVHAYVPHRHAKAFVTPVTQSHGIPTALPPPPLAKLCSYQPRRRSFEA